MESLALEPPRSQARKAAKEKSEETILPTVKLHRHPEMCTSSPSAFHRPAYTPTGPTALGANFADIKDARTSRRNSSSEA